MSYEVVFPSPRVERQFQKTLEKLSPDYQTALIEAIRTLSCNPHPRGKRIKKLKGQIPVAAQLTAEYRLRIGPYRLLYDVDDREKRVVLLKLLKRNERTYK